MLDAQAFYCFSFSYWQIMCISSTVPHQKSSHQNVTLGEVIKKKIVLLTMKIVSSKPKVLIRRQDPPFLPSLPISAQPNVFSV